MTIEMHRLELEALIEQQMASGKFRDPEEVLMDAIRNHEAKQASAAEEVPRKGFSQMLRDSPLSDAGLAIERIRDDGPRPVGL